MRTGTVSYKLEDMKKGVIIPIGFVGENDFTRVIFDAEEIYKKFPNASVSMKVQPPKGVIYPATVTRDGNTVIWQVKEADVANRGGGELQLTFTDGETKIKTYIAKTDVKRSLAGNGPAPDPVQDWIDEAEEVLEEVEAAEINQPTIGEDGYWYTWNQETGEYVKSDTKAQGADGAPGQDGAPGRDGTDATPTLVCPAYADLTFPVTKDTLCYKDGTLYKAKQDISTSETWTAAHWDATNIDTELRLQKTAIHDFDEEIATIVGSMYSETADGGEIVHIQNGSDLPFSSLITNLDLVQEGSGDAGLDNVRNISAVTGATAYVSATQDVQDAESYPVEWGSTVATVASGEVDLVKGTITETWEFISVLWKNIRTGNVNETTGLEYGVYSFPHTVGNVTAQSAYGTNVICNVCSTIKWNGAGSTPYHFYIENNKLYIYLPSITDGETEIQLAVKLSNQIEHSISGAIINGLKDCYVWTNAGNVASVSYVAQMDEFVVNTRKTNDTVSEIIDQSLVMENAVPFGFATANGEDSISATTYWNTGLVHIPDNSSVLKANATIYKTAFYDTSRTFISCNNTIYENIPIPANTKYVKVQISNSVISFANRGTLRILCDSMELTKLSSYAVPGMFTGRFEYEGERIVTKPLYETYPLIASASCQAGCVYGDSLFRFKTDGTFLVYDLITRAKIADGSGIVVEGLYPHCNTACFGEKYNSSDPYPLLYVNAYNTEGMPKGTCYVFRISVSGTTMTASLIQTINVGFVEDAIWKSGEDIRPYGNFCVDLPNKALFVYTLRDTGSVTRFFRFALPAISNATVTLSQSDIVEYWDTDYFPYIQDNACAYGKIYLCSGYGGSGSNPGMIHVIDTIQRKETSRINLYKNGMQSEPEILDFYNGDLICGDSGIYSFRF